MAITIKIDSRWPVGIKPEEGTGPERTGLDHKGPGAEIRQLSLGLKSILDQCGSDPMAIKVPGLPFT